jgi:hypothetical protein
MLDGGVRGRVIRNTKLELDALIRDQARRPRNRDAEILPHGASADSPDRAYARGA